MSQDPLNVKKQLETKHGALTFWDLKALQDQGYNIDKLPFTIRILLENALRNYDNFSVTKEHVETILGWTPESSSKDIPFKPARVLMQDFTGVPAVVDIASLRAEATRKGKNPEKINPLIPVDLVIDHSVQVDYFGSENAYKKNVEMEYQRNGERYEFLKWAQENFDNFSVVPPGMGICHQVNLEYLAQGVIARDGNVFPDTLVGTDSHTPMVNGIGVLGWGVGGIEAEAAILNQPVFFIMPEVVGLKLTGKLPVGTTATDMVLTITELMRRNNVVGKFVEVFGSGLDHLSVPDRATIANMSPEFGCTVTYFPIDDRTLEYMAETNRPQSVIDLVRTYCKENMLWRENETAIQYSDIVALDLSTVEPTISGPKRPQDKILLRELRHKYVDLLKGGHSRIYTPIAQRAIDRWKGEGGNGGARGLGTDDKSGDGEVGALRTVKVTDGNEEFNLHDGSIVIAAITSCTNTSNPSVMIGAGLVARKAVELGLDIQPWVKTSLAPGSKVVTDYLEKADLLKDLEALKFHTVGYGCTSCIGNSGPLAPPIAEAVTDNDLIVASALSGNRNFEARIHSQVKMNFLMSPMLVVAFALAGRIDIDLYNEPLGHTADNKPVFLRDIWPSNDEINELMRKVLSPDDFKKSYGEIYEGNEPWKRMTPPPDKVYQWNANSTYIKEAPFFKGIPTEVPQPSDINGAYALLKLGDFITTDHISPAGSFGANSRAGQYLIKNNVEPRDFNSYGSRRGNDELMVRGTFANVRIKNELVGYEGGFTQHIPSGEEMTVFDAAQKYIETNTPLVVLTGKEYGSGSSRDWAAKGTSMLGVKAVIAESYERIHRSNLVGMGVLPLEYVNEQTADTLNLNGREQFTITGIESGLKPLKMLHVSAMKEDGTVVEFDVRCRLDSQIELEYYLNGGILHYVLRQFLNN